MDVQEAVIQQPERVNLLGMTRQKMEAWLVSIGEKPFRAQQILKWIHHSGIDDFEQMSNLGKGLRAKLAEIAEIRPPRVVRQLDSKDGKEWRPRLEF